jgi:hypothetical protein
LTSSNDNFSIPKDRCPICSKATVADYAPFCSKRCANVDLHRWLSGGYAIPAAEEDDSVDGEDDR